MTPYTSPETKKVVEKNLKNICSLRKSYVLLVQVFRNMSKLLNLKVNVKRVASLLERDFTSCFIPFVLIACLYDKMP